MRTWNWKRWARAAALAASLAAGTAGAADMQIDPIYIHLKRDEPATVLRIRNGGKELTRYQLDAFSWAQDASAAMRLEPTQDILLYPNVFALKPGEQRLVRVGTTAAFGDKERTFRIFVEEFAPDAGADAGVGLHIRTRVGLPVFLDPPAIVSTARIDAVSLSGSQLTVRLKSTGNAHLRLGGVEASAVGVTADAKVYDQTWGAAYLLSGNELLLKASVPRAACGRIHAVKVRVATEKGPIEQTIEVPPGGCRS